MAVAAHVSRVAKEYAPYGYSIMEDVVVRFEGIAVTGAADDVVLSAYVASDADSYVESASVVFDVAPAADATWDMAIINQTSGETLNSAVLHTQSLAAFTEIDMVVDQDQVVPQGDVLSLSILENGVAVTALPAGALLLRIRRKA